MSFILTVWRQAADLNPPTCVDEAQAQLDRVQGAPLAEPDPRFGDFVRALAARFPATQDSDDDIYDLGSPPAEGWQDKDAYFNLGLWTGADRFDAAYAHAVVQANDRGLHVMDGQNGLVYLSDGQALALHEPQRCLRAYDALQRKDHAAAWAEYRRLAPLRDRQALREWGFLICNGKASRRHLPLGAAVALLGGSDPAEDSELARCLAAVPPGQRALQDGLLQAMRAAPDLAAFVDAELARIAPAGTPAAPSPAAPRSSGDATSPAAAQALGIAPDLLARAEAGDAKAQLQFGYKVLYSKAAPTRAHAQLAAQWLERAARQGQETAQAVLGEALLRGKRALPIDIDAGLRWLEQAAAANEVNGLNALALYLYDKSTRDGRKPGYREKLKDADSVRHQQRVLELLTRSAALGSQQGTFKLAVRLYDEIGTPRDDVAAKAVMQLVKFKWPDLAKEQAEVMAMFLPTREEAAEVFRLTREMKADPTRLPEILASRRAALHPPPVATPAPRARRPEPSARPAPRAEQPRRALHRGHLALAVGAAGFVLLLAAASSLGTGSFRALMLALGLAGAYGTWRCSGDLDWGTGKRVLLSALALLPVVGSFACMAVLMLSLRRT